MIADDPRWDAELLDALRRQAVDAPAPSLDAQRRAADAAAVAGDLGGAAMATVRWTRVRDRVRMRAGAVRRRWLGW